MAAIVRRFVNSAISAATRSAVPICLERFLSDEMVSLNERVKLRFDTQFFNVFNHPILGLPSMVLAGFRESLLHRLGLERCVYDFPPTGLLGVGLGVIARHA